jgi:hypothetical protein
MHKGTQGFASMPLQPLCMTLVWHNDSRLKKYDLWLTFNWFNQNIKILRNVKFETKRKTLNMFQLHFLLKIWSTPMIFRVVHSICTQFANIHVLIINLIFFFLSFFWPPLLLFFLLSIEKKWHANWWRRYKNLFMNMVLENIIWRLGFEKTPFHMLLYLGMG